jgi:hypothetical protein
LPVGAALPVLLAAAFLTLRPAALPLYHAAVSAAASQPASVFQQV